MNEIFETSFDTFAYWYLDREMREKGRQPVPLAPDERRSLMETAHGGKMRGWFVDRAHWLIGELTSLDEIEQLMILQRDWTQYEGFLVSSVPRPGGPGKACTSQSQTTAARGTKPTTAVSSGARSRCAVRIGLLSAR